LLLEKSKDKNIRELVAPQIGVAIERGSEEEDVELAMALRGRICWRLGNGGRESR
jgi:hypothetical protein